MDLGQIFYSVKDSSSAGEATAHQYSIHIKMWQIYLKLEQNKTAQ